MLAGLPAEAREAFLLRRLDGLTYSEIASRLGVSSGTVKNYISSALVHCYPACMRPTRCDELRTDH